MAEHDLTSGERGLPERELNVSLNLTEQVTDLKRRVLHLETLDPSPVGVNLLDISVAEVTVSNTTTETSIYSFSIPANTLGVDNALDLFLEGTIQNTSGGGGNIRVRVKYGGTTIFDDNPSVSNGTNELYVINARIFADGAENAQKGALYASRGADTNMGDDRGTAAVDSTTIQTLEVTVEWSAANPAAIFVHREAVLKQYVSP